MAVLLKNLQRQNQLAAKGTAMAFHKSKSRAVSHEYAFERRIADTASHRAYAKDNKSKMPSHVIPLKRFLKGASE